MFKKNKTTYDISTSPLDVKSIARELVEMAKDTRSHSVAGDHALELVQFPQIETDHLSLSPGFDQSRISVKAFDCYLPSLYQGTHFNARKASSQIYLLVGNERNINLEMISLKIYLQNFRYYLSCPSHWDLSDGDSLWSSRDEYAEVDCQASFIPVAEFDRSPFLIAYFNSRINIQRPTHEPYKTTLLIVASKDGTSTKIMQTVMVDLIGCNNGGRKSFQQAQNSAIWRLSTQLSNESNFMVIEVPVIASSSFTKAKKDPKDRLHKELLPDTRIRRDSSEAIKVNVFFQYGCSSTGAFSSSLIGNIAERMMSAIEGTIFPELFQREIPSYKPSSLPQSVYGAKGSPEIRLSDHRGSPGIRRIRQESHDPERSHKKKVAPIPPARGGSLNNSPKRTSSAGFSPSSSGGKIPPPLPIRPYQKVSSPSKKDDLDKVATKCNTGFMPDLEIEKNLQKSKKEKQCCSSHTLKNTVLNGRDKKISAGDLGLDSSQPHIPKTDKFIFQKSGGLPHFSADFHVSPMKKCNPISVANDSSPSESESESSPTSPTTGMYSRKLDLMFEKKHNNIKKAKKANSRASSNSNLDEMFKKKTIHDHPSFTRGDESDTSSSSKSGNDEDENVQEMLKKRIARRLKLVEEQARQERETADQVQVLEKQRRQAEEKYNFHDFQNSYENQQQSQGLYHEKSLSPKNMAKAMTKPGPPKNYMGPLTKVPSQVSPTSSLSKFSSFENSGIPESALHAHLSPSPRKKNRYLDDFIDPDQHDRFNSSHLKNDDYMVSPTSQSKSGKHHHHQYQQTKGSPKEKDKKKKGSGLKGIFKPNKKSHSANNSPQKKDQQQKTSLESCDINEVREMRNIMVEHTKNMTSLIHQKNNNHHNNNYQPQPQQQQTKYEQYSPSQNNSNQGTYHSNYNSINNSPNNNNNSPNSMRSSINNNNNNLFDPNRREKSLPPYSTQPNLEVLGSSPIGKGLPTTAGVPVSMPSPYVKENGGVGGETKNESNHTTPTTSKKSGSYDIDKQNIETSFNVVDIGNDDDDDDNESMNAGEKTILPYKKKKYVATRGSNLYPTVSKESVDENATNKNIYNKNDYSNYYPGLQDSRDMYNTPPSVPQTSTVPADPCGVTNNYVNYSQLSGNTNQQPMSLVQAPARPLKSYEQRDNSNNGFTQGAITREIGFLKK